MTGKWKIVTGIGASMAILVMIAAWCATKGCGVQEPVADASHVSGQDCFSLAVSLYERGEWESGASIAGLCRGYGQPGAETDSRIGSLSAARDDFRKLMKGWSPPWPKPNGTVAPGMSPEQAAGRIRTIDKFIMDNGGDETAQLALLAKSLLLYYLGRYDESAVSVSRLDAKTPLSDRAGLLRIMALVKAGRNADAITESDRFALLFPGSPVAADAVLWKSRALAAQDNLQSAVALALEIASKDGAAKPRGRALLLAALLYDSAGEKAAAVKMFCAIPENYPMLDTDEKLDEALKGREELLTSEQRLILGRYFVEKERGFAARKFLSPIKNSLTPEGLLLLARANMLSDSDSDALKLLEQLNRKGTPENVRSSACILRCKILIKKGLHNKAAERIGGCMTNFPDTEIEALQLLAKVYTSKDDEESRVRTLMRLTEKSPALEGNDANYLRIARWFLKRGDDDNALKYYRALDEHFPDSPMRAESLFWQAKTALKRGDQRAAAELFSAVQASFPYSYFNFRSGAFLSKLGRTDNSLYSPDLKIYDLVPAESPNISAGNAFRHLNLMEQAREGYLAAAATLPNEAAIGLSRLYREMGNYPPSAKEIELRVMVDREFYFRVMADPSLTKLLYARLYEAEIKKHAAELGMDPVWPMSIIRQESRFQADAVSSSNAVGLMQIIPSTGKWIAEKLKIRRFRTSDLYDVETNLDFGIWYFDQMLKKFEGNHALALAAYNGGPGNVSKWIAAYGTDDMDMFIERIPRDETRGYVKKVMHNYFVYSTLLKNPSME